MNKNNIRNFSIIAHIDHGKSTLSDRIIETTKGVDKRDMQEQILDSMDIERERGITIKLNAVQLNYKAENNEEYTLHLIDTPGHVDFTYEVSRSLAACEGAILVVDAVQGVEAQTLANVYLALDNDLEIIPVINKIDLPAADPERVKKEIEDVIGIDASNAPLISAKTGLNIEDVLEAVVENIPAPIAIDEKPLRALVFDSYFDQYKGAVASIRVVDGTVKVGDTIKFMEGSGEFVVTEINISTPNIVSKKELVSGEVGTIAAGIKQVKDVMIGDTITLSNNCALETLPGYKKMLPMVFSGLFPIDSADYEDLKEALEKMQLNDASLEFEPESSQALGFGFRCGFLGMLHAEIIQERIEREFNIPLIATAPSVIYHVNTTDGEMHEVVSPSDMPDPGKIESIAEPYVTASIMVPNDYVGPVMDICQKKRGEYLDMSYIDERRVLIKYHMPLSEVIFDFFDRLKSSTKGYASLDYEFNEYRTNKLVKMDILLNGDVIDALSIIVHKDFAYHRGKAVVVKLKEIIPKQMFEVPIQAAIGNKVIARETVKAMRKNVLAKCYGGDVSRKKKLLNKQKKGKERMKQIGSVEVPQEAFMTVLSIDD